LAEQCDLFYPRVGEFGDLVYDCFGRARDFGAAYIRDNTIGAKIITASHRANVRLAWYVLVLGSISRFEIFEGQCLAFIGSFSDFFRNRYGFLLFPDGLCYEFCYLWYLCGSADDIDGFVFEQFGPETLRHTADDTNYYIRPAFFDVL
jgi:hypothetical protein